MKSVEQLESFQEAAADLAKSRGLNVSIITEDNQNVLRIDCGKSRNIDVHEDGELGGTDGGTLQYDEHEDADPILYQFGTALECMLEGVDEELDKTV